MSTRDCDLPETEIFEILSNERRRFILSYLERQDGVATLEELSNALGAREYDVPPEELNNTQYRRLYVSIYQTHIPRLEDAGVLEYDSDSGRVTLTDCAPQAIRYLSVSTEQTISWESLYLALAVVSIGLSAVSLAGIVFDPANGPLALVIALLFAVLGSVHYASERWGFPVSTD